MRRIVLTGASGPLGRRVEALAVEGGAAEVVGLGTGAELDRADLSGAFEGADTVVHLASAFDEHLDVEEGDDVPMLQRVLDAAAKAEASQLVVLSSAVVYGAWANNAVPLTEAAPLRPNPEFAFAVQRAEIERLVGEWRDGHPGAVVTILRPVPAVAEGGRSWLAEALRAASDLRGEEEPPAQYLHVDDLAAAVDRAWRERLDGAFNVAPDGWLSGPETAALASELPRVPIPDRLVGRVAAWRWRLRLTSAPPGLVPYVREPWVVANDRLRATGWAPTHSNEEAYVAGHPAGPWATLSPRRRQELALGGAATVLVGAAAGVAVVLRRRVAKR